MNLIGFLCLMLQVKRGYIICQHKANIAVMFVFWEVCKVYLDVIQTGVCLPQKVRTTYWLTMLRRATERYFAL